MLPKYLHFIEDRESGSLNEPGTIQEELIDLLEQDASHDLESDDKKSEISPETLGKIKEHLSQELLKLGVLAENLEETTQTVFDAFAWIIARNITLTEKSAIFAIEKKVKASSEKLGVSTEAFVKAALKKGSLFCQSPERLNGNVEKSAELLGVKKEEFVKAALKQGSLFWQSPETLNGNVENSAKLLGVKKEKFVNAALKQGQLFYQSPETLNTNVEKSAELLGVKKEEFVNAALKQGPLFCQSPETIAQHATDLQQLYVHNVISFTDKHYKEARESEHPPVIYFLLKNPGFFCRGSDNFELRQYYQAILEKSSQLKNVLDSRKTVEKQLIAALNCGVVEKEIPEVIIDSDTINQIDPNSEKYKARARNKVLRALIREGLIKSVKLG